MAVGIPHNNVGSLTGTTSVALVSAPSSLRQNIVGAITVYNADSVAHDITLRLSDGGTHTPIEKKAALAAGDSWTFANIKGHIRDTTTKTVTAVSNATATTTEPTFSANWIENVSA